MMRPPALLFGVPIADTTMDETVAVIGELVDHGRATGRTHQVATVNVDFLVNAFDDPEILKILQHSSLCLPDGMPIVWGARVLGTPLRERVAGSDLVPRLVHESQRTGWHVHFFGSTDEVVDSATRLLKARFPGARFSIDPGPNIRDVSSVGDDVLESIRVVDADIVCIALGNPKQERFIATHGPAIRAPVMIGIGGSLDMLVGKRRRAPEWVQRIGLEWVVRAAQEPGRLGRRYAHDIRVFGPKFGIEWRRAWRRRDAFGIALRFGSGVVEVRIGGNDIPSDATWRDAVSSLRDGAHLLITATDDPGGTARPDAVTRLIGLVVIAEQLGTGAVRWGDRTARSSSAATFARLGVPPGFLRSDDA